MSVASEKVKRWRKNTKKKIVIALGGCCVCCGYNQCQSALHAHHLDPTEKEFRLGAIRGSPQSWSKIVSELMKCVLVCANCHAEIHAGLRNVPSSAARFNESLLTEM